MVNRTPIEESRHFPFDIAFQGSLLRLLCEDDGFAHALGKYLQPHYFENEVMAWAYSYSQRHVEEYGKMPSLGVLLQKTRTMDARVAPVYTAVIEQVMFAPLDDEQWLKDNVLDFVKRNIFARTFHESRELYNSGKISSAYDLMQERMEELYRVSWEEVDDGWIADEYGAREVRRSIEDPGDNVVPTGFNWLDHILNGGLSLGELGIWIAYSKVGKTTMLVQHGKCAVRDAFVPTAHFVFESSRKQVENRYDASFSGELYAKVKSGNTDAELYQKAFRNYQLLKGKLVVSGFVERWNYTVKDIDDKLKELKRSHGFRPRLVIVDYGDLLTGRERRYNNEYERQKAAFRDLKSLANRGYALWTASQAQRPKAGVEEQAHFVKSRQIADSYEKIRVSDFIGSLNQTPDEKTDGVMRLYAELYRENSADCWIPVKADMARMTIEQQDGIASPSMPVQQSASLGFVPPTQLHAPI